MHWSKIGLLLIISLSSPSLMAIESKADDSQKAYEREIKAVVRHKMYYKAGRLEVGGMAGVMPYDSLINHVMVGGHLDWHLTDHYGWQILELQLGFPTVTDFTTNLVQTDGISRLETVKLKLLASTSFKMSPIYGKIRFFGRTILHLDVYLSLGLGIASTETLRFESTGKTNPGVQTVANTGTDPMLNVGLGFKVFLNDAMGMVIDLRDYVVSSQVYGSRSFKSNFAVFLGLSFFIPTFG